MNTLTQFIVVILRGLTLFHGPVGPEMGLFLARGMWPSQGWMPSMFLFALSGCQFIAYVALLQRLNAPVADVMAIITWMSWAIASSAGILLISTRSIQKIWRLNWQSLVRCRIWFEISQLAWHATVLTFVLMLVLGYVEHLFNLKMLSWLIGKSVILYLLAVWAITGTTGYVLAVVSWRMPNGRAFECVNFFLPLIVGMWLIACLSNGLPGPINPFDILLGSLGVIILASGLITSIKIHERFENFFKLRASGFVIESQN